MGRGDREDSASLDERARFDRLFREHADAIYGFCLSRTHNTELAEDARSTVFFEAWRRRHEIDVVERPPRPWLLGVAANVIRNQRRSSRRYEAALKRVPRPRPDFLDADEIVDRADADARAQTARQLLARLSPGERAVMILCVANGLSYAATAEELGLPVGTVRSRLFRARVRLQTHRQEPV